MGRHVLLAVTLLVSVLLAGPTLASMAPHGGGVLDNTRYCAVCHRTHNSEAAEPPGISNEAALCYSCHGSGQTGAATNVQDGRYSNGDGLKGGGFERAVMDPGLTGTPSEQKVTSAHSIDSSLVTAWGSGDISSEPDSGNRLTLRCSSCHDPHGNGNYRMLRGLPKGMPDADSAAPVEVLDEGEVGYTIAYDQATGYRDTSYVPANMGDWCAQCHTRYAARADQGHTRSGDAVFTFRHTVDLPGSCLRCHAAHGTTAVMGQNGGLVNLPDGTPGNGSSDSRLLHINGRGSCLQCHSSSSLTEN